MRKRSFKRVISVMLAATMLFAMAGCGKNTGGEKEGENEGNNSQKTVSFPLEEEVSFDIMYVEGTIDKTPLEESDWWQELYKATNVKINFVAVEKENLNALFSAGLEGDAWFGQMTSDTDTIIMASNELIVPLEEYIKNTDLMPNFNERVLAERPEVMAVVSSPDGHIYSLPNYAVNIGGYLESPIWINKAWLDKLGMDIPKTIEDLEKVLIAFRDNDMNGNGIADDEIPYMMNESHNFNHMEAMLGLWGIATKDGKLDSYVYVKDGEVLFAPTADAYKEAIKTLNRWWEEDLIWSEAFTTTGESYGAKLSAEVPLVGMMTGKTPPTTNEKDYIRMAPVSVKGYEASWYIHPGYLGVKNAFTVTRSCENVEILMHWVDLLYTFENSVNSIYGAEKDGRYKIIDDKIEFVTLDGETKEQLKKESPALSDIVGNIPAALNTDDYENRILLSGTDAFYMESYELYEEYITDEVWPRPYIAEEDANRAAELRTDLFNTVSLKRAEWVTGVSDIDEEWDSFKKDMEKMGIKEYIEIYQRAYDTYKAALK